MIQLRKFESQNSSMILFRIFYFWPCFHSLSGSLPPISSNTGQPKIVASPAEVIDNLNKASVWKPSSPAIILPINAFGQTLTPSIEKDAYPTNVSASIGRTAYLKCKIKNLGHKSVWNLICHQKYVWMMIIDYTKLYIFEHFMVKYVNEDRYVWCKRAEKRQNKSHYRRSWCLHIKAL